MWHKITDFDVILPNFGQIAYEETFGLLLLKSVVLRIRNQMQNCVLKNGRLKLTFWPNFHDLCSTDAVDMWLCM